MGSFLALSLSAPNLSALSSGGRGWVRHVGSCFLEGEGDVTLRKLRRREHTESPWTTARVEKGPGREPNTRPKRKERGKKKTRRQQANGHRPSLGAPLPSCPYEPLTGGPRGTGTGAEGEPDLPPPQHTHTHRGSACSSFRTPRTYSSYPSSLAYCRTRCLPYR